MARFENRSRQSRGDSRGRGDRSRGTSGRDSHSKSRYAREYQVRSRTKRDFGRSRGPSRESRYEDRRDSRRGPEMTQVVCDGCGDSCEVPFKPTSNKPIYCKKCFSKDTPNKMSDKSLDIINEKLNKIMKALDIR